MNANLLFNYLQFLSFVLFGSVHAETTPSKDLSFKKSKN